MAFGEAQKGFSIKSKLFDSLKSYLDNKNRLQPIIGLGSIIECVKAGTDNREAMYICEVCMCRLSKADMRNHIIGSLHRYNYIKARQPQLVSGWKSDLSKLAWPLMDIAKILEGKEGPGNVQLVEVEEDAYQWMTTHSENDAITLLNSLRDGQGDGEPEGHPRCAAEGLDNHSSQSHRIVLLGKNQSSQSKKYHNAETISHQISSDTNQSPSLLQSTAAPPGKPDGLLKNIMTSQWDSTQMPSKLFVPLGRGSFGDGYTGNTPLIGLFRVVECRSDDGITFCYLCHCCRIRCNTKDMLDHLTSSSHIMNYLVETRPEQVEIIPAAVDDNCRVLQSLAKKVEQDEGRGDLEVVNAPESLCIQLTGKSYHWCMKMLYNGWTDVNSRQKNETIKGPSVNTASVKGMPVKYAVVPSKYGQRMMTKRKRRQRKNTVFKVSLPLTKGAVLLERTSFSKDILPVTSACSPSFDPHPIPSTESETEDFDLDSDKSFTLNHTGQISVRTTSNLQQELVAKGAGQHTGPEGSFTVTQYEKVDGHFSQSGDTALTKDREFYAERNYNMHHSPQERSTNNFNTDFQTQHEVLPPAVSHIPDWSSSNSSYWCKEDYAEQWYNAVAPTTVNTAAGILRKEGQKNMRSDAYQNDYQQQLQYMKQDHANFVPGSVGHYGYLDAARINMYSYSGGSHAPSANTAQENSYSTEQFQAVEQRQLQTYMELTAGHVSTAPESYRTQPMAYQPFHVDYGLTYDPNYSTGPGKNYYETMQPIHHAATGGGASQIFVSHPGKLPATEPTQMLFSEQLDCQV